MRFPEDRSHGIEGELEVSLLVAWAARVYGSLMALSQQAAALGRLKRMSSARARSASGAAAAQPDHFGAAMERLRQEQEAGGAKAEGSEGHSGTGVRSAACTGEVLTTAALEVAASLLMVSMHLSVCHNLRSHHIGLHGMCSRHLLGSLKVRQASAGAYGPSNYSALAIQVGMAGRAQGSSGSRGGTPALTGRTAWRWRASPSALQLCQATQVPLRSAPLSS